MPRLTGILETCLHVADLARSIEFYRRLFSWPLLARDDRFVALAVADKQVMLLFLKGASEHDMRVDGGVIPGHGGDGRLHVAFAIPADDLEAWQHRLADQSIALASIVLWPSGGTSLYFRDPDEHLVELATPGVWAVY
ncbi:MAG TPA: VOC family protein [Gemmataceae bacterium]|jgi:catechol 2,3-dioxygenase-like lactoylglutathione lyase family enzyme|nr:VOC family protein [Gemmataceae bacterium]